MWHLVKRVLQAAALLLLLVTVASVFNFWQGGAFRSIERDFAGECRSIPLAGSSEDIEPDRERNFVYLSLLDRAGLVRGEAVQGDILRIDMADPTLTPQPALRSRPVHFRPHGMSLYIDGRGQRHLFVINHPADRANEPELVELFREVEPGEFEHVRSFSNPQMNSPNDMVAVGPEQFYAANDKVTGGAIAGTLQQFGIGGSPLVYFDGDRAETVVANIALGGGIAASADGRTLYVAETAARRLRVLERTGTGGEVAERARIPLGTSPDNVDVHPDGSIWVGAHPNVMALIRHFVRGTPAPSQVLRIDLSGDAPLIEQIYLDTGEEIPASSVGVSIDGRLLIGSITARQVLACEL
ncbi:MAG: SMP-30/gluconolactonase/LRE family protein [Chromatiales bacterium]|nr:SMP-30/gluconolactonase/LRE family protein [Chromatiales bacterium]